MTSQQTARLHGAHRVCSNLHVLTTHMIRNTWVCVIVQAQFNHGHPCTTCRSLQVRDFLWARHPWDVSTLRQLPDITSLHYQLLGVDFPHAPVLLLLGLSGLSHLHTLHLDFKTFQVSSACQVPRGHALL